MKNFYERNSYLLDHPVNVTFETLLWMTSEEFRQWCIELRKVVVYTWDVLCIPPRVGYNEEDIIDQFKKLESINVSGLLVKDELTGNKDTIRNTRVEGNAVNQFFPTMMKTPINYTTYSAKGRSIYDYFAKEELLDTFVTYASRHFKRDSFYHYSNPAKYNDNEVYNILPVSDNGYNWIEQFETNFRNRNQYDYWIKPKQKDKKYSGYNLDISSLQFLTVSKDDIMKLNIPNKCKTNMDYKDKDENYQICVFALGQKIFPLGLKAFRVSFSQYATNFPSVTAKWVYETFCPKNKKSIVWDPSMGWGGRLVGALAVKDDREILYLGNDPNRDHIIKDDYTKYHAVYDFYTSNIRKGGLWEIPHNKMKYWCLGSEDMQYVDEFQEYKGKIDLVFTSPPYFNKEAYSNDDAQSYKKYPEYELWRDGFLYETLKTAYQWLKKGGHLCWNISDIKLDKDILPLVEDSKKICLDLGFEHIITYKMCLSAMPGGNRVVNGVPKTRHFVQIDDNYHKIEPMLVMRK